MARSSPTGPHPGMLDPVQGRGISPRRTNRARFAVSLLCFAVAMLAMADVARSDDFGALAVGVSGTHLGTAVVLNYPNQSAADSSAIKECEARASNCRVVGRFSNGGCGYVALAGENAACWGSGATPVTAISECQSKGCGVCRAPIFGCLKSR